MVKLISIRINNRTFQNINQASEYIESVSRIFPKQGTLDWDVELTWDRISHGQPDSFEFVMGFMHKENPDYSPIMHDIILNARAEIQDIAENPDRTLGMKPDLRNLYIKTCAMYLKDYEMPINISA